MPDNLTAKQVEFLARMLADLELHSFLRQPMPRTSTPPPSPERQKALGRLRDLKRLRDGTTYEGERSNAQAAMDRLMAKHGITDREI